LHGGRKVEKLSLAAAFALITAQVPKSRAKIVGYRQLKNYVGLKRERLLPNS